MAKIIGPDVSFYQDDPGTPQGIDFARMRQMTNFVIVRSGQNIWPDTDFKDNWRRAKEAGLPRGSYWFYDSRTDPKQQADLWYSLFDGDLGELPLFADFEEAYKGPFAGWQKWRDFLERIRSLVGTKEIGIYTAYYYWQMNAPNANTQPNELEYFHRYPLWIANYGVSQPLIPRPWGTTEWLFWQFTATGDGHAYGVESNEIDLNYFNGDAQEFARRFGVPVPDDPPPDPPPGMSVKYRVNAAALNVREGPGTTFRVLATLVRDEIVEGLGITTDAKWIQIKRADGLIGWCASQYLVRIITTPPPPPPPPPPDPVGKYYRVTATRLNIREGPGLIYRSIGALVLNEVVQALGISPDGGWIQIKRADGLTGWCSTQWLVLTLPPPEPPPPDGGLNWFRVTATRLNLREGPGTNFRSIGSLARDEVVKSIGVNADAGWIQIRRFDGLSGWCSKKYLFDLGNTMPNSIMQRFFPGVTYYRSERVTSRKLVSHALVIDLLTSGLRFLVTPPLRDGDPPLCTSTTSEFLYRQSVQIAVNGDSYTLLDPSTHDPQTYCPGGGEPADPFGFAASRGIVYSEKAPGRPVLYISQRNGIAFEPPRNGRVYNAISGDRMLVEKGKPVTGLDASRIDPRTAIGFNRNNRWMTLIVVDGREASEGATFAELADLFVSFGVYTAMSLDGGGSSTMVVEGVDKNPHVLNIPIEGDVPGRERAVANHLGIFVRR